MCLMCHHLTDLPVSLKTDYYFLFSGAARPPLIFQSVRVCCCWILDSLHTDCTDLVIAIFHAPCPVTAHQHLEVVF